MIKTIAIIALGLSTTVLGISTGYLSWQRSVDKKAIATLTESNTATAASIREIVTIYNDQVASGKVIADGVNADLSTQLESLVNDYNETSGALATTKAQLDGSNQSVQNLVGLVDQLNAANTRIAELEAQATAFQDIQNIADGLNAANSKIAQLEAELAAAKAQ